MPENDLVNAKWAKKSRQIIESLVEQWNSRSPRIPEVDGNLAIAWGHGNVVTAEWDKTTSPILAGQRGLLTLDIAPARDFEIRLSNLMRKPEFEIGIEAGFPREFPHDPKVVADFLNYCNGRGWGVSGSYQCAGNKVFISSISAKLTKLDNPHWLGQCLSILLFAVDLLDGKAEGTGLGDFE